MVSRLFGFFENISRAWKNCLRVKELYAVFSHPFQYIFVSWIFTRNKKLSTCAKYEFFPDNLVTAEEKKLLQKPVHLNLRQIIGLLWQTLKKSMLHGRAQNLIFFSHAFLLIVIVWTNDHFYVCFTPYLFWFRFLPFYSVLEIFLTWCIKHINYANC